MTWIGHGHNLTVFLMHWVTGVGVEEKGVPQILESGAQVDASRTYM